MIVAELRVRHAKRLEDPCGGELTERFPRRAAHDDTEQRVAGVVVQKLRAGREVEGPLARDQVEQRGFGEQLIRTPAGDSEERVVVPQSAGMVQELLDGDWTESRNLRDPFSDVVRQREI